MAKLDVKDNGVPERMQLTILPAIRMVKARDNEIVQYTGGACKDEAVVASGGTGLGQAPNSREWTEQG